MKVTQDQKHSFADNRSLEELFMDNVLDVIKGRHLLSLANAKQDMTEATDLMVLKAGQVRLGVRVRRPYYFDNANYRDEVTIRCKLDSGVPTEYQKVMDGWGDMMFYGFANPCYTWCQSLRRWTLYSLDAFRWIAMNRRTMLGNAIPNGDGTHFYALNVRHAQRVHSGFVVDSNWKVL